MKLIMMYADATRLEAVRKCLKELKAMPFIRKRFLGIVDNAVRVQ